MLDGDVSSEAMGTENSTPSRSAIALSPRTSVCPRRDRDGQWGAGLSGRNGNSKAILKTVAFSKSIKNCIQTGAVRIVAGYNGFAIE